MSDDARAEERAAIVAAIRIFARVQERAADACLARFAHSIAEFIARGDHIKSVTTPVNKR